MTPTSRPSRFFASVATVVTAATFLVALRPRLCRPGLRRPSATTAATAPRPPRPGRSAHPLDLRAGMRGNCGRTTCSGPYATVDSFFHNPRGAADPRPAAATERHRQRHQALLRHEGGRRPHRPADRSSTARVPVLQAQSGDQAALKSALDAWYAMLKEIADFLDRQPEELADLGDQADDEGHIDQTTAYATDLLKGDYASAIEH